MDQNKAKRIKRSARHNRVRSVVSGTPARPRLFVFRANRHIYAQVIDDAAGKTLAAASSLELAGKAGKGSKKTDTAKEVGRLVAGKALAKNIKAVKFDRGGFAYHGRVKALAEGAREGGLEF
ncbi:MAG TPA: 50S ribosomal protein L18 [Patescibacteria group bacterium]|nr:50S ribosomal protein L18 [Patescibacteria group bacterium]